MIGVRALNVRPHGPWWPPRAVLYLLATGITGLLTLVTTVLLFAVGGVLAVVVVGVPLLAALALTGVPVAALERVYKRQAWARGCGPGTPSRAPGARSGSPRC